MLREIQVRAVLDAQYRGLSLHPLQRALPVRRQDVLRPHLRVRRMVDQAVVAAHRRLVVLRRSRKGLGGRLRLLVHDLHQPLAQAYIAQRRAAELVLGPHVRRQLVGRAQRLRRFRRGHAQLRPPVARQRVEPDRLHRHRGPAGREAAAPGGLADPQPVGGGQRSALVQAFLDKGFHEQGAVAVALLAVVRQAAQGEREGLGGEVPAGGAGADQEAAQPDHAVQLAAALVGVPADEGVAGGQREGRGGEAEGPQHALLGDQQVAQLGAGVLDGAARVLAAHQLVPDPALGRVADLDQCQPAQLVHAGGHADRRRHGAAETARAAAPVVMPGHGQSDLAGGVERAQGSQATGQLGLPAGVQEAEPLADPAADFHAASRAGGRHQRLDARQGCGIRKRAGNPVLLVHVLGMAHWKSTCEVLFVCKRQPVSWYEIDGDPLQGASWNEHVLTRVRVPINSAPVGLDSDGDLDIVASSRGEARLFWFDNLGGPQINFQEHSIDIAVRADFPEIRVTGFMFGFLDFNADARLDLLLSSSGPSTGTVIWLEQPTEPDSPWAVHRIGTTAPDSVTGLTITEIDGDGHPDIFVGSYSRGLRDRDSEEVTRAMELGRLAWFENPGDLQSPWIRRDISRRKRGMFDIFVARDLDSDGDMDVVGTRGNSVPYDGVYWLEQVRTTEPQPAFSSARETDSGEMPLP